MRAFTHIKGSLHLANFGLPPPLSLQPFFLAFLFACCHAEEIDPFTRGPGLMTSPNTRFQARTRPIPLGSSGNDKYLGTEEVTVELTEREHRRTHAV